MKPIKLSTNELLAMEKINQLVMEYRARGRNPYYVGVVDGLELARAIISIPVTEEKNDK
jgi:hypothetical protein